MKMEIGHLAFTVSDMGKSMEFYVGGLGFTHAFSLKDEQGAPWIEYLMMPGGQFVELFYAKPGFAPGSGSYMHLCIEVDDCEKACADIAARGAAILTPPRVGSDRNIQAWIADPDGNRIELMQIDPESPQARSRASLGRV